MTNFLTTPFDDSLRQALLRATLGLKAGVYGDFYARRDFLESCERIQPLLDNSSVGEQLDQLRHGELVGLVLQNAPTDIELPAAPLDGLIPSGKRTFVSEGLACILGQKLGFPSALLGEKLMQLIHQITPVAGNENAQSNAGKVALGMHQDLAPNPEVPWMPYHKLMATWLILSGLQIGAGGTSTYVATIDDGIARLQSTTVDILKGERFVTDPPDSFKAEGMAGDLPLHAILIEHDARIEATFDVSSNVRPSDPHDLEAVEAITLLHEALAKVKHEVYVEPGTVVLFNNRRVVHGRGEVRPGVSTPGKKRWIQRLQVFELERIIEAGMPYPAIRTDWFPGLIHLGDGTVGLDEKIERAARLVA